MRSEDGLRLDWITADRITVCTLQEEKISIQEDLYDHYEGIRPMHLDDVEYYEALISALYCILEYYGES